MEQKNSTGYRSSLFSELAVVLLSFFMNNLLGLSIFINNSYDSEARVCSANEKQAELCSSEDKEKREKRKRKSRIEDERSLPLSDGSKDVVCTEDLHDAGVEKRRKTVKSRESNTLGNEDKEKSRKRKSNADIKHEQTRKEKHRKKDRKRKVELLDVSSQKKMKTFESEELGTVSPKTENRKRSTEQESGGPLPKKFKDAHLHSAKSVDSNDDVKDVSKNEVRSRRRKRKDMDAAEKDSWASQSHNPVPTTKTCKRQRDEDIANMVSQKQGFEDEDKLHHTVFVRNLPLKTKKKHLLREFSQFGEVESVRLRLFPIAEIKMPGENGVLEKINECIRRSYAYVIFKNEQSANAAVSHNMTQFGGNHIFVGRAQPPSRKREIERRKSFAVCC